MIHRKFTMGNGTVVGTGDCRVQVKMGVDWLLYWFVDMMRLLYLFRIYDE